MKTIVLLSSYLSRLSSRCTAILVVTYVVCCLTTRLPEISEVAEKTESLPDPGSSTKKQCASSQQPQDDTTVLLQGGRIKVERLSEDDFVKQIQQAEVTLQIPPRNADLPPLPMSKFTASLSMSQTGESTTATVNPLKKLKASVLSLLRKMPAFNVTIEGSKSNVGVWLIISMVLCTVLAACGVFMPAMLDTDEKRTYLRTNDHLRNPPWGEPAGPPLGSSRPPMSGAARMTSPLQAQLSPDISYLGQQVGRSESAQYARFGGPPSPTPTGQPYMSGMPVQSPLPLMASGLPTMPQDDPSASLSKRMPPPLCPTLVLPVCEARFGVPMFEIAQFTSEGDLGIVGLSGNTLLRASVRKVGMRRALEISMPEAGSAPRATIGPNPQDVNRPEDGALEIRGLKRSFYGMLEMRASGACYVRKDSETIMIIDGDTDSLQLSIKSGGGMPLAWVRCSTEPFGGVDHVEIRVEPGVDTVLVLACVLAVLLLSPSS